MKKSSTRLLVSLVMLVFVNFMFSNTLFTHAHKGADGRTETHSHPYLPSAGHGHSSNSLDLVSAFNMAASAAQASQAPALCVSAGSYSLITEYIIPLALAGPVKVRFLRGPPSAE